MKSKVASRYTALNKIIHWTVSIVVITMLTFSFFLDDVPEHYQSIAYTLHKSFGFTILALMIFRIGYIYKRGKPSLPDNMSLWERILSKMVLHSFYLLLIIMPLKQQYVTNQ